MVMCDTRLMRRDVYIRDNGVGRPSLTTSVVIQRAVSFEIKYGWSVCPFHRTVLTDYENVCMERSGNVPVKGVLVVPQTFLPNVLTKSYGNI